MNLFVSIGIHLILPGFFMHDLVGFSLSSLCRISFLKLGKVGLLNSSSDWTGSTPNWNGVKAWNSWIFGTGGSVWVLWVFGKILLWSHMNHGFCLLKFFFFIYYYGFNFIGGYRPIQIFWLFLIEFKAWNSFSKLCGMDWGVVIILLIDHISFER